MSLPPDGSTPRPNAGQTSRGRRSAPIDTGTVALAVGAMTFYWALPIMMGSRSRRRRPKRPPQS